MCPADQDWFDYSHRGLGCYHVNTTAKNITQAKAYCESMGTHMVEVDSKDEQILLVDTILADTIGIQSSYLFWLGMDAEGR